MSNVVKPLMLVISVLNWYAIMFVTVVFVSVNGVKYNESKNFRVFIEIAVKLFSYVTDTLWDSINFSVSDDIDVDDFTCKLFTKPVGFCS